MALEESLWERCLDRLEGELPGEQFHTWIAPLQAVVDADTLRLLAPNRFVRDKVDMKYAASIRETARRMGYQGAIEVCVGSGGDSLAEGDEPEVQVSPGGRAPESGKTHILSRRWRSYETSLNKEFTFESLVEGKCNQIGRAAALQISENPGGAFNPLFIYGGVGLGKTHLMHATGWGIQRNRPGAKVVYLHSERFVTDMVTALRHNLIDQFKSYYRSVDALLIDDIQFFVGKDRSQEEFFHTFNALLEDQQQVILTCDRFPKSVDGLEERLKSRFGWGLTVHMEPPELETRAAILKRKAESSGVLLPDDVAFFIAKRIQSNVRELEGALKRVAAYARFTGRGIGVELTKEALKDLLALQDRQITLDNIQKTVAEYYKVRVADLLSKRRNRSIARPRQIAMALAKEVTQHSLPEIGDAFGGRDHTTVLHACRKVGELRELDANLREEYRVLLRTLTG